MATVPGKAAGPAGSVLAHESMCRLSIFGDLLGHVIFIWRASALYRLLSSVNKTWAMLMVAFVLVSAAVGFLNALNNIAAVILFRGGEFLAWAGQTHRAPPAMVFIRLPTKGEFIRAIFLGVGRF